MHIRRFISPILWIATLFVAAAVSLSSQETLAVDATIDGPTALAIDNHDHLFVLEMRQHRVRRIDIQTGTITTVAGDGRNFEHEDGTKATDAVMGHLSALAVDSRGNLFIGENVQVRRVDAQTGLLSTVAGNSKSGKTIDGVDALSTPFWTIDGLALDDEGNLFIASGVQRKIFKVEAGSGVIRTYAGTGSMGSRGDGGAAINAAFQWANSLAVDRNGDLFIADSSNCRIRRIDHSLGVIDTIGISGDIERACEERLKTRNGASSYSQLAIDAQGNVYFVDGANGFALRIDSATSKTSILGGTGGRGFSGDSGPAALAQLSNPSGLAVDSRGNIYIADFVNNRVRRVDGKTHLITTFAGNGSPSRSAEPLL